MAQRSRRSPPHPPPLADLDPKTMAEWQLARDREATARAPWILARKHARMAASSIGYLRGAAPLFYAILSRTKSSATTLGGEGWISGDLHLENFGAFRTEDDKVTFDLNDFDEATTGRWAHDVLRLATSLLLAARSRELDGRSSTGLVSAALDAYVDAAFGGLRRPPAPAPIKALIAGTKCRTREALLDARTKKKGRARRFVHGARYAPLPPRIAAAVPVALERYLSTLPAQHRPDANEMEVIDSAYRIAGTGSLGALRIAALVRGKGGANGAFIFDLKEENGGSVAPSTAKTPRGAERVATAMRASLASTPRLLGTTTLGGASLLVRKLMPQEDKLDFATIDAADLGGLARYLAHTLGTAHARGATRKPRKPWRASDVRGVVDESIWLASLHEGAYLAFSEAIARRSS